MSRGLACCTNPQPGEPGNFWSRFSSSSLRYASIKLQCSITGFGPPRIFYFPGTLHIWWEFPYPPPDGRLATPHGIRNNIIKQKMNVTRSLLEYLKPKQFQWYGHVQRMEKGRLPKEVLKWHPSGRRKHGRPKLIWAEGIKADSHIPCRSHAVPMPFPCCSPAVLKTDLHIPCRSPAITLPLPCHSHWPLQSENGMLLITTSWNWVW
jgi:hypothetical protein